MYQKIIRFSGVSWLCLLSSVFFSILLGQQGGSQAMADPESFCQLSPHDFENSIFHGGGARQYKSTLPSQFWQRDEERIDPLTLNNHLIVQAPTQILADTNCDTNLFGSGVNPGATTVDTNIPNLGISTGSNASGFYQEPENDRAHNGIQISTNTGFDSNN